MADFMMSIYGVHFDRLDLNLIVMPTCRSRPDRSVVDEGYP
ncbi:hypothetical protein [Methylorubrum thiocyanatum]